MLHTKKNCTQLFLSACRCPLHCGKFVYSMFSWQFEKKNHPKEHLKILIVWLFLHQKENDLYCSLPIFHFFSGEALGTLKCLGRCSRTSLKERFSIYSYWKLLNQGKLSVWKQFQLGKKKDQFVFVFLCGFSVYRLIDQELLQSLLSSSSVSTCAFSGLRPIPDQTRGHTDTHSSASIHTLQSRYSHRSTGHMTARCQAGICRGGRRVKPSECRTVEVQTPLFILP